MDNQSSVFEGGFSAPVYDAQKIFHELMHALANPGQIASIEPLCQPPAPCSHLMGAVALTVLDQESPAWFDEVLSGYENIKDWLTFHTGAPIIQEPHKASFAFIDCAEKMPLLSDFALGNQEYPDRSSTIILKVSAVGSKGQGDNYILKGPGIDGSREVHIAGLPQDFCQQWQKNNALFPCGVDLILVAGDSLLGLPRTTKVQMKEA